MDAAAARDHPATRIGRPTIAQRMTATTPFEGWPRSPMDVDENPTTARDAAHQNAAHATDASDALLLERSFTPSCNLFSAIHCTGGRPRVERARVRPP